MRINLTLQSQRRKRRARLVFRIALYTKAGGRRALDRLNALTLAGQLILRTRCYSISLSIQVLSQIGDPLLSPSTAFFSLFSFRGEGELYRIHDAMDVTRSVQRGSLPQEHYLTGTRGLRYYELGLQ